MIKQNIPNINAILLGSILAQILIYHKFLALTIVLWGVLSIVNLLVNKEKVNWKNIRFLFVLLYLLYVLGVFYSSNKPNAYFDLEVKMSLVIFPVFIGFTSYSIQQLKLLFQVFTILALLSIFHLLISAGISYFETKSLGFFFYNRLSPKVHPSYFAFYLNVIMMVLIYDYITGKLALFNRNLILIIFAIFTGFIGLLTAKIALVTTFILGLILLIYWIKNSKWIPVLVLVIGGVGTFGTIYTQSEFAQERIDDFFNAFELKGTERYLYSTGLRKVIWQNAWDLYKEKPLMGHGTGDVTDNLVLKYEASHNLNALEKRLNAHNQFLQTGIAIGIGGLVCLLVLMFLPLIKVKRNLLFAGFTLLCILFLLTESAFETQAGVIGILLLYSLFSVNPISEKK